jgi:mRNA interferase HigB
MHVISKSTLKKFWLKNPDSELPLQNWHKLVSEAKWETPAELKTDIKSASLVGDNRFVFNIKGNTYRLVTYIDFKFGLVFILWIGTHREYDKINVKTIVYDKSN